MSNIHAAVGLAQLEKLSLYLIKKVAHRYIKVFKKIEGIQYFKPLKGVNSSWWLFTIIKIKK